LLGIVFANQYVNLQAFISKTCRAHGDFFNYGALIAESSIFDSKNLHQTSTFTLLFIPMKKPNFTFLFNILLDFGITNFNNRNIAQNNHLLNKHFSGIALLRFVLAAIYFIVIFTVVAIIGYDSRHFYFPRGTSTSCRQE